VGLAARIAICTELVARTNGYAVGSTGASAAAAYGVALHEAHFRDLLFSHTTPPAIRASDAASAPSLLTMGFPSRVAEAAPSLCACHGVPSRGGYACPRCKSKVCGLPAQCPVCELQLIQSTHLARSYHHLFPLRNYEAVAWEEVKGREGERGECRACLMPFPGVPAGLENGSGSGRKASMSGVRQQEQKNTRQAGGASESSRYRCTTCNEHFCIDCDVFAHEVTHNCAGCLSRPVEELMGGEEGEGVGNGEINGNGQQNGSGHAMDVDS